MLNQEIPRTDTFERLQAGTTALALSDITGQRPNIGALRAYYTKKNPWQFNSGDHEFPDFNVPPQSFNFLSLSGQAVEGNAIMLQGGVHGWYLGNFPLELLKRRRS